MDKADRSRSQDDRFFLFCRLWPRMSDDSDALASRCNSMSDEDLERGFQLEVEQRAREEKRPKTKKQIALDEKAHKIQMKAAQAARQKQLNAIAKQQRRIRPCGDVIPAAIREKAIMKAARDAVVHRFRQRTRAHGTADRPRLEAIKDEVNRLYDSNEIQELAVVDYLTAEDGTPMVQGLPTVAEIISKYSQAPTPAATLAKPDLLGSKLVKDRPWSPRFYLLVADGITPAIADKLVDRAQKESMSLTLKYHPLLSTRYANAKFGYVSAASLSESERLKAREQIDCLVDGESRHPLDEILGIMIPRLGKWCRLMVEESAGAGKIESARRVSGKRKPDFTTKEWEEFEEAGKAYLKKKPFASQQEFRSHFKKKGKEISVGSMNKLDCWRYRQRKPKPTSPSKPRGKKMDPALANKQAALEKWREGKSPDQWENLSGLIDEQDHNDFDRILD